MNSIISKFLPNISNYLSDKIALQLTTPEQSERVPRVLRFLFDEKTKFTIRKFIALYEELSDEVREKQKKGEKW